MISFLLELGDLFSELGHFRHQLLNNVELSLTFLVFEVDHFDLFFFLPNLLLSVFQDVFLDVGFFIQNTKFVVAVDELNTHVVSILAGLLVGVDQVVHFFLERVDDQV